MKNRLIPLLLCAALLCGSALASQAPEPLFSDVPADSWHAPYVEYVSESGVMVGTGEGLFSPDRELTRAECLTLAVRLYDLRHGGDGVLKEVPEDWGTATITTADGKFITRQSEDWDWKYRSKADGGHLSIVLDDPELVEWGKSQDGLPAALTLEGSQWTGVMTYWESTVPDSTPCVYFNHDGLMGTDDYSALTQALYDFHYYRPGTDRWYRSAYYTADLLGLGEEKAFSDLMTLPWAEERANRLVFARALALAAGALEPLRTVDSIPDVARIEYDGVVNNLDIYSLYEAGILNGVDEAGTFAGEKSLTRAEAAAMAARVLVPTLRIGEENESLT